MTAERILLLPVETIAREFDGKLLLALFARERNWKVFLGDQTILRERLSTLPRGVYVSKSARRKNAEFFRQMHRLGHRVAVLDEEALVRQTDDIYVMKHERDALDHVDVLMTWGEENTQLWTQSDKFDAAKIATTGNPRVDMLRRELGAYHRPELDDIHRRFGDYVLFNSNFATVNHFIAGESRFHLASWVPAAERQAQTSAILAHKQALFDRFRTLLPKVARAIAPLTLVVRPHPSESHEAWESALAGESNTAVVFEGSVVPWIAGATALLHNGCTTAVEGAVMGITNVCYRPVRSASFDNPLPNGLSIECGDDDALVDALKLIISKGPVPLNDEQRATLDYFICAQHGDFACERMIEALGAHGLDAPPPRKPSVGEWASLFAQNQWSTFQRRMAVVSDAGRNKQAYRERKFPTITDEFINSRIARFQSVLNRFPGAVARPFAHNLFVIE